MLETNRLDSEITFCVCDADDALTLNLRHVFEAVLCGSLLACKSIFLLMGWTKIRYFNARLSSVFSSSF